MTDDILTHRSQSPALLSRDRLPVDGEPEILSLRPTRIDEYIGQAEAVETLKIAIEGSPVSGRTPGPRPVSRAPGFGKDHPGPYHCQ